MVWERLSAARPVSDTRSYQKFILNITVIPKFYNSQCRVAGKTDGRLRGDG